MSYFANYDFTIVNLDIYFSPYSLLCCHSSSVYCREIKNHFVVNIFLIHGQHLTNTQLLRPMIWRLLLQTSIFHNICYNGNVQYKKQIKNVFPIFFPNSCHIYYGYHSTQSPIAVIYGQNYLSTELLHPTISRLLIQNSTFHPIVCYGYHSTSVRCGNIKKL